MPRDESSATTQPKWLADLEARLRADLTPLAARLQLAYPKDRFSVNAMGWGQATGADGYIVYRSCILAGVAPNEPDDVALEVSFSAVNSNPEASADVCWGHPSGFIEVDWQPDEAMVRFDQPAQESLLGFLPSLMLALEEAVARRRPADGQLR